jgi:hypothetical protein
MQEGYGIITKSSSGGGGTNPGGANTNVQFNNANAFGGNANFTYDPATGSFLLLTDADTFIVQDAGVTRIQAISGQVAIGGNAVGIVINDGDVAITVSGVPEFLDDAAAIGGGLTAGRLYKTTTLGSTFLKIVP